MPDMGRGRASHAVQHVTSSLTERCRFSRVAPRGEGVQMSETDFTCSLFACQNLSLIVRGHCLREADSAPEDPVLCERETWGTERDPGEVYRTRLCT